MPILCKYYVSSCYCTLFSRDLSIKTKGRKNHLTIRLAGQYNVMMYDTHHILHRITLTHTSGLKYSIIFEISLSLSPPHTFLFHFHLSPSSSLLSPVLISPSPPVPLPPPSSIWGSLLTHTLSLTTLKYLRDWINSSSTPRPKFPPQNALLDLV